jgi:FKBP-type peptidyl-prolyl cis-trans isomerase FkpA
MKRILFGLFAILTLSQQACVKGSDECAAQDVNLAAPAAERTDVRNYLTNNGLTAVEHSSGFFYSIVNPGSTTSIANLCSSVTVKYTGKLTNGTVFDATPAGQTVTFDLYRVIIGWQKGMSLIQKGGKINLYIPPTLGYGSTAVTDPNTGAVIVPANSILVFEVELIDINNR